MSNEDDKDFGEVSDEALEHFRKAGELHSAEWAAKNCTIAEKWVRRYELASNKLCESLSWLDENVARFPNLLTPAQQKQLHDIARTIWFSPEISHDRDIGEHEF